MKIRKMGKIRRPTADEIAQLAKIDYLHLSKEEVERFVISAEDILNHLDRLDDIPEKPLPVKYPQRDRGYRPNEDEDPYNIFITKCLVRGASKGKLFGKKVGLKDNISLQGVPMTNASRLSETYIPNGKPFVLFSCCPKTIKERVDVFSEVAPMISFFAEGMPE
ncbi:MAG: hypothetical protein IH932_02220, partial [Thaumarchaeota archaeon]|nr:hypothetical protein [Nitrososphaerota archaeon]